MCLAHTRKTQRAYDAARGTGRQRGYDWNWEKLRKEIIEQIEIELKYRGYIVRQETEIDNFRKFESMTIPEEFNFEEIRSLSSEGKEKLSHYLEALKKLTTEIEGINLA